MKKVYFLIFLLISFFVSSATCYKVLFIGNSYTSVNDLPTLTYSISKSAGDTLVYFSNTPGGCTFQQHLTQSAELIQQGGWDYVILQEQSQLPSFPYDQFINESYPYAQQLCSMIRQYNSNAKIIFYMTWGRKNGDSFNCQFFPPLCTYEGMDSLLYERYMMMAEDNETMVSPVGYVWHNIRDNYPDIELYEPDESHPSLIGSYVAACCIYTTIFQKDPTIITYNADIDENIANMIRSTTQRLVYDSLTNWIFPQDNASILEYNSDYRVKIFPNPASSSFNVIFDNDLNGVYDFDIYNNYGVLVKSCKNLTGESFKIDTNDMPVGIYVLRVRDRKKYLGSYKIIIAE